MSQFRTKLFPFCVVEEGVVGDGTLHPFPTTRDKCMEWFWRVKKWTVIINVSSVSGAFISEDVQFSLDAVLPSTERDLICMVKQDPFGIGRSASGTETVGDVSLSWQAFLFSPWIDSTLANTTGPPGTPGRTEIDALRTGIGSYWPQFLFRLNYDGLAADLSTHSGGDGPVANVGLLLDFDGHAVRCYAYSLGDIVDVTWTPQEWWPYEPTSGGDPIFDTTDGSQINPLVVVD